MAMSMLPLLRQTTVIIMSDPINRDFGRWLKTELAS